MNLPEFLFIYLLFRIINYDDSELKGILFVYIYVCVTGAMCHKLHMMLWNGLMHLGKS